LNTLRQFENSNSEKIEVLKKIKSNGNIVVNTNNKEDSHLKNFKLEFNMLSNSMHTRESRVSNLSDIDTNVLKFSKDQIIKILKEPITQNYSILSDLGTGTLGTVKKVLHKKLNEERAMKIIDKKYNVKNEIEILKKISHPNIISIYEIYEDSKNYNIITEYLEGGELFEMIATQINFSEVEAANIMKQLMSSLVYLHNKNIVHRDLKPENIMLVTKKDKNFEIKLIDFSTAKHFDKNKKLTKFVGTSYYVAPEVLEENYDEKCDVWSCGVILYILLCGYPPFNGSTNHEIYNAIKKNNPSFPPEEWKDISKEAIDLIKQMLNKDLQKRFSAFKCLNHKWFKILETSKDQSVLESTKQMSINVIKKMAEFVQQNKFKQAILQFISTQFNLKAEEEQLRSVFSQFDPFGKGIISKSDFKSSLVNLFGENEAERLTESIFKDVDLDGSGEISYDEFITTIVDSRKVLTNGQLEMAFRMLDKDNSGSISVEEICNVFGGNSMTWKDIINEVDINGDGEIDFEEFKLMMCDLDKKKLL
jgi:calcium-dependent protein kinase